MYQRKALGGIDLFSMDNKTLLLSWSEPDKVKFADKALLSLLEATLKSNFLFDRKNLEPDTRTTLWRFQNEIKLKKIFKKITHGSPALAKENVDTTSANNASFILNSNIFFKSFSFLHRRVQTER